MIECNNGLVAALISDPKTDKAAVALTVQVGSAADPDELQGLAHFLEHMLFLGSEKFPAENDYKKFLIEHSGAANASTSIDKTTYYLTVSPDHLEGALDRFSQFFIKPLLTPDMTEREVNAVNMECERNRKVDRRRLMRLERWLCKMGHPYRKFSTGNKKLLDTDPRSMGVNVRGELLNFHEHWYSANIMKVAVVGKESLDELEDKVGVFFSPIADKNIDPYKFSEHPYGDHETGIIYFTSPVKNRRSLELMFPCPDFAEYYTSGPVVYVKYLLERTSKGTLYSLLRKNFWINSRIETNLQVISKGVGKYHVRFNLTEEGLSHYEEIIHAFFQYVNMIKTQCTDESFWNECAEISKIKFEYKEKSPPQTLVLNLVESLTKVPYEDILVANYKLTEWNPKIIKDLLNYMRAKNARIRLVSKKYENSLREEDSIYGVKYKIEKIPLQKLEKWDDGTLSGDFKISLDGTCANNNIPKNFDLITPEYPRRTKPEILFESKYSRVWYLADHHYLLPKAYVRMNLYCAPTHITPLMSVLGCLMFSKMEDLAIENSWDAESAGMASKLEKTRYGWQVSLSGYSDIMPDYLITWAKAMATMSFNRDELIMRRDTLKR